MLSDKQLERVQGGWWFIDLAGIGTFLGASFGTVAAGFGFGGYKAHDSMGHYGHIGKVEAKVKPVCLASPIEIKTENITVLNSDNMRDLEGAHISVGITANLPPILRDGVSRMCGKAVPLFGVISKGGVGGEVSIPVINTSGKHDTVLIKTSTCEKDNMKIFAPPGSGYAQTGVQVYASVSLTKVDVEKTDQMESYCYTVTHPTKKENAGK